MRFDFNSKVWELSALAWYVIARGLSEIIKAVNVVGEAKRKNEPWDSVHYMPGGASESSKGS